MDEIDRLLAEAEQQVEAHLNGTLGTLAKADNSEDGKKLDEDVQELEEAQSRSNAANDEAEDEEDEDQKGKEGDEEEEDPDDAEGQRMSKADNGDDLIPVDATDLLAGIYQEMQSINARLNGVESSQASLAKAVQGQARTGVLLAKAVQSFGNAPARPRTGAGSSVRVATRPSDPPATQRGAQDGDPARFSALLAKAEQGISQGRVQALDIGTANAIWNDTRSIQDVLSHVPRLAPFAE